MRIVLVSGISGSGKSIAINVLEDDGYFCIDNLPIRFLHEVITSLREAGHEKVAVSVDARSGESVADLREIASGLGRYGHDVKIIFLNARTDTLVQRYSETRRRHPMSLRGAGPDATGTLVESKAKGLADIAVLSPEEFIAERIPEPSAGIVRMLQEGRQQFDILDSKGDFSPYRVLVLPDAIAVRPAARLRAWPRMEGITQ